MSPMLPSASLCMHLERDADPSDIGADRPYRLNHRSCGRAVWRADCSAGKKISLGTWARKCSDADVVRASHQIFGVTSKADKTRMRVERIRKSGKSRGSFFRGEFDEPWAERATTHYCPTASPRKALSPPLCFLRSPSSTNLDIDHCLLAGRFLALMRSSPTIFTSQGTPRLSLRSFDSCMNHQPPTRAVHRLRQSRAFADQHRLH